MANGDYDRDDRDSRDDRDDDRDDRPRRRRGGYDDGPQANASVGQGKAKTPGVFLLILGVLGILFAIGFIVLILNPEPLVEVMKQSEKQAVGEQKERMQEQIRVLENPTPEEFAANITQHVLMLLHGLVVLITGILLMRCRGYPLAAIGSIVSILPCNWCCCLTLPIAIWATVVVFSPDVKAAFEANRQGGRKSRDGEDDYR